MKILLIFIFLSISLVVPAQEYKRVRIIPQNEIIATTDSLLSLSYIRASDKKKLREKIKAYQNGVYFIKKDSSDVTDVTGLVKGLLNQLKADETGLTSTLYNPSHQFGDTTLFKTFYEQEVYKKGTSNFKMEVIVRYTVGDKVKEITITDTK